MVVHAGDALSAVEEAIRERRSIRRFQGPPLGRDTVERLLAAACMAPSPHNAQPWRFAAVLDSGVRDKLAQEMGRAWRKDLERDGVPTAAIDAMVAASCRRLTSSTPIVVCLDRGGLDHYPDEGRQAAELTMAVQSLGAAIQNLLLAAHALDLGAVWMCAPLFCGGVVRSCLGLDDRWEPQALILLGTPAERPRPPRRKRLSDVALFIGGST